MVLVSCALFEFTMPIDFKRSVAYAVAPMKANDSSFDSSFSPYWRDVNRILYSKAYARYADKTQVVYLVPNDHISRRGLHVQLVSSLGRQVAESLQLNSVLVEAIALGHDCGHAPFGHEGEGYLSQISQQLGQGPFRHPWQSCRLLTLIEPLELSLATLDGILCHDGGLGSAVMQLHPGKSWEDHKRELQEFIGEKEISLCPMTLEGCLVKLCDKMAYLVRDLIDATRLGLIQSAQIPETALGVDPQTMRERFLQDVISQSRLHNGIAISPEVFEAILQLRRFCSQQIYFQPSLKTESAKIERGYRWIVEYLLEDARRGSKSLLWTQFLHSKDALYLEATSLERQVLDYVSGMTDGYFLRLMESLFMPARISLPCIPF